MISKRTGLHKTQLADIVTFIILWHFFFASSFVLRLNPKVFLAYNVFGIYLDSYL